MISKATTSVLLFAFAAAACSSPAPETPQPKRHGFAVIADSIVHVAARETMWGLEVWDQARDRSFFSHNSGRRFVPASNMKQVTTVAAFGLLGPDWRYTTPVMIAGESGDSAPRALIVRASGDPTWSRWFHPSDATVLEAIADSLYRKGVRRIAGDVVIDATLFDTERVHPSWKLYDLAWYYAAPTAAFAIGDARLYMVTTTGADSGSARVRFVEREPDVPVVTRIRVVAGTTAGDPDVDLNAWPDTLVFVGNLPPNMVDTARISVTHPERHAAQAFVSALDRRGIKVAGRTRVLHDRADVAALPAARTIVTWHSPPLSEIAAAILKPSNNWITEQVLKTLGAVKGTGGSWTQGRRVIRRYLIDVARIDSAQFRIDDGSGLTSSNLISPHALTMLLEHARRAPWAESYRKALPVPGGIGTLARRLTGLSSQISAKTGSIANVNTLCGYVRTDSGRDLTACFMANATGGTPTTPAIDSLMKALVREKNWEQ